MQLADVSLILTLHCEHASRLLSDAEDRPLRAVERMALYGHLIVCISCRRYRAYLRLIDDCIRRWRASGTSGRAVLLNDAARSRMRRRIAEALGRRDR